MFQISPLKVLFGLMALFVIIQIKFWFEPVDIQDFAISNNSLDGTKENAPPYNTRQRLQSEISPETPNKAYFESLGHINKVMPIDARLRWTDKNGNSSTCWLEKGQILICPPLTQNQDLKLEVLDVQEVERDGAYDYELWLKEVESGQQHRLALYRLNHQVRLFP